ncbi:hypothetical protein PZA11_001398 [Diplocarpon coronariae]
MSPRGEEEARRANDETAADVSFVMSWTLWNGFTVWLSKDNAMISLIPIDISMSPRMRRIQIQMTRRAYRRRKETTIASLEQELQELRGNNEEKRKIFNDLHGFAVRRVLF